ncbi:MAG: ABC transporter ATP-binding protein [Hyphomicrobiaceae bacterium]
MLRWFEKQIDPFVGDAATPPPGRLAAFYWHYLKPMRSAFAAFFGLGLLAALIEVSLFAYLGSLVDLLRNTTAPGDIFATHGGFLLWMAFVAAVARPVVFALEVLVKNQLIAGPVLARLRWQIHRYVLRQSLGFFQNEFAGRVANRVMQTSSSLRESVVMGIDALWFVIIYTISALVLFAQADLRLMIPLSIWVALYIVALFFFVPRVQARAQATSEARSRIMARIVDSYTNILTVKMFAHTAREDTHAKAALAEHLAVYQTQLRLLTGMNITLTVANGLLIVLTTGLAVWLWSKDLTTLGAIALTTGLAIRIVNMSQWVMWTMIGIFDNIGAVEEGMRTIARPHEVLDRPDAAPLTVARGEIRYEGIRFHYGKTGGVIDNLSLTVRPGEKVGLVGRSGAGKSTLVHLLLRFYDLERGRILIDGQDIADVAQDSLRAQIGMVTQDTSLLHRSVRDNILYGRPDADEAAVIAAATRAQAHDFIAQLEDLKGRKGYASRVGERGVKLSGGQRQRVAIARVLLKDAPILILDEATSALDSEVEAAIQEQLYNLMAGKTVIAIAHRLSTIAAMDRLVIMDGGRIVEEGNHRTLLQRGGIYAELWARQSGGFLAKEAAE